MNQLEIVMYTTSQSLIVMPIISSWYIAGFALFNLLRILVLEHILNTAVKQK